MSKYLVSSPDPCPPSLCLPLHHPTPAPLQLAYCVVQFLEKDATLTEHVSTSGVCVKLLQSCTTFGDPMGCQAPLSMGFSRQEYWSGLPFPHPGDLPNPGIKHALAGGFFTTTTNWDATLHYIKLLQV